MHALPLGVTLSFTGSTGVSNSNPDFKLFFFFGLNALPHVLSLNVRYSLIGNVYSESKHTLIAVPNKHVHLKHQCVSNVF